MKLNASARSFAAVNAAPALTEGERLADRNIARHSSVVMLSFFSRTLESVSTPVSRCGESIIDDSRRRKQTGYVIGNAKHQVKSGKEGPERKKRNTI